MSKSIAVWVYLKRQKIDSKSKMPLYVRVTIDGDYDDFSLSRKILSIEWSQVKQKCIGKTHEALQLNAKIAKIKGDLTALFDRIPVSETVKAKRLIKLYHLLKLIAHPDKLPLNLDLLGELYHQFISTSGRDGTF
jgi:Arm DNA-binding domain